MNNNHILVVDDELDIRHLLQEILTEEGYEVEVAADAAEARRARARRVPDLVLLDIWMPDVDGITLLREWSTDPSHACPVVMMSGHGTVETAVEATRLGAVDFVEKPLSLQKLLRTVERALDARRIPSGFSAEWPAMPVGRSRQAQQLRADLQRLAAYPAPLLLLGEAGSECDGLARYVHSAGPRAAMPFVTLRCGSVRESDFEAMLLGSSGSPGLLAQAAGGTLLLSEIEDLPPAAQPLLTSLLASGRIARTGETPVALDARVIATTQPMIENHLADGTFRRDLHAQLSVLMLRVPPLREYSEDVPELLRHQVDQLTDNEGLRFRRFSVAAQNRLRNYPWPGNLVELRNLVRRLLLREGPEEIALEELERELGVRSNAGGHEPLVKQDLLALPLREAREQFERSYLQQQLQLCHGRVGLLAKRVGMERTHLYRKLRSLGIEIGKNEDE